MAFHNKRKSEQTQDFNSITISLASPDSILNRSHGEVLKPETINYRSYKPERDGLFCERIFGPVKDYECYCGKYKRIRYRGIVCDRCGVEVTEKKVRRERMGHIQLVVPVVHTWFFRTLPNKIGYILGIPSKYLQMIIYYERYAVIQPGVLEGEVAVKDLLTEEEYFEKLESLPKENQMLPDEDPQKFVAKMGAEAIHDLLVRVDYDALAAELRQTAATVKSQQKKSEALKRLKVVEAVRDSAKRIENRPEWAVIKYLPVIPPELRPLVPLDGGRFASSDLNDLYRRVIIRNNRLRRLLEIRAPEVILRNEKRMLQEAVDSLFDNSRKSNAVKVDGGRALKSLSGILKGKQGRFRQNLLGKRVDYSGRSVIVVGPNLKLHECGIPKGMAAELFKPFIIKKLLDRGIVKTVKSAKKHVDLRRPVIWEILENILKGHPVLLNRAPTLHRLSIQAFQPVLIEGKAIRLHPLVCTAFNADFDGDQMAVHVPLSSAAILEAQVLMLSAHNMLNPQNGTPITLPSQDMVLGLYYLTKALKSTDDVKVKGEGHRFYSPEEVYIAYDEGKVDLHAEIEVRVMVENENKELVPGRITTTVGRVLFNRVVPDNVPFVNQLLTKKNLKKIIHDIILRTDVPTTARFLDDIKEMGFFWSFKGGLSFNLGDLIKPSNKDKVLAEAQRKVDEIQASYTMGIITDNERYNKVIDIWNDADREITETLMKELATHKRGFNSVYMMLDSGARGSKAQIKQLCGMRGLMAKPRKSGDTGGSVVENPILANFVEGLSVLEYFISTHGARKGLADTALKTADAGYLTRRLVDVAQDVVIREEDCNTLRGIRVKAVVEGDMEIVSLADRIEGRFSLHDVYIPGTDDVIVGAGEYISTEKAKAIEEAGIEEVEVRSVMTCDTVRGVCAKCYGKNLATGRLTEIGDAVGIIAAQSIGEPGTQLTLRTFHVGGVASVAKTENSLTAKFKGRIEFDKSLRWAEKKVGKEVQRIVITRTGEYRIVDEKTGALLSFNYVPYGSILHVNDGDPVDKGTVICSWDPFNNLIISQDTGIVQFEGIVQGITYRVERSKQTGATERIIIETKDKKVNPAIHVVDKKGKILRTYPLPVGSYLQVEDGQSIEAGDILVKIPRTMGKIQDITGGLPRVVELFEARNPAKPAIISDIDGIVRVTNTIKRGNREYIVESKDKKKVHKYLIPLSRHVLVQDGDLVRAGTPLTKGALAPRDILNVRGAFAAQMYLLNGVQQVYRSQGININDKHIEVIIRQMMRQVEIVDPGDTTFLERETALGYVVQEVNDQIINMKYITDAGGSNKYKVGQLVTLRELREENSYLRRNDLKPMEYRDAKPATTMPVLLGLTKASLATESWISAASFQETTKVLSMAAIAGKTDRLLGLKENVIVGKKIPAGTGMRKYDRIMVMASDEGFAELPEEGGPAADKPNGNGKES